MSPFSKSHVAELGLHICTHTGFEMRWDFWHIAALWWTKINFMPCHSPVQDSVCWKRKYELFFLYTAESHAVLGNPLFPLT